MRDTLELRREADMLDELKRLEKVLREKKRAIRKLEQEEVERNTFRYSDYDGMKIFLDSMGYRTKGIETKDGIIHYAVDSNEKVLVKELNDGSYVVTLKIM